MHSAEAQSLDASLLDALVAGQLADERLPELAPIEEYRLVRRLGQGGMGCVYLAHDTLLDRPVALKFLTGLSRIQAARQRFLIEARAIARLQHPNVVSLYRIGQIAGHPFLVSEYVRGQSLDRLPRPLPAAQVVGIGIELSRGLAAAHRRGVLHRDLKPANALLATDGTVKLLDFGLAKLVGPLQKPGVSLAEIDPITAYDRDENQTPRPQALAATLPPDVSDSERLALAVTKQSGDDATTPLADDPLARSPARPLIDASTPELTQVGAVMGTPLYMAPEMWRGEPATPQVDVYSLGALLYELASGRPPHCGNTVEGLREDVFTEPPPLGSVAADFDPQLAAVVDRCLRTEAQERYASAEELCQALQRIEQGTRPGRNRVDSIEVQSNPYRGLRAFDQEDSALFFGRRTEVGEVLERLGAEPLVLVAGDSGVGKSSLCRAGVLARVLSGAWQWEKERRYAVATLFPGRHPAVALADVLAPFLGCSADILRQEILTSPQELARRLQRYPGVTSNRGLILFIDQLEELCTQSSRAEVAGISEALGLLTARVAGLRVLATARGDFLTRLAALPGLGPEIGRALYILRPLGRDGLREAIVGPAESGGVRFESAELVSELVDSTLREGGGLPLLQFTLAELWDARDVQSRMITVAALRKKGGVTGALSRHADRTMGELLPAERSATKRLFLRLVTADGLRARRTRRELLGEAGPDPAELSALEALVRGRLLVARDGEGDTVYEIAHEALVSGWQALKEWLGSEAERRALRERLRAAAAEWGRFFDNDESLWGERQLRELLLVGLGEEKPSEIEAQFLRASRRRVHKRRWVRRLLSGGALLALCGLVLASRRTVEKGQRVDIEMARREQAQRVELGSFARGLAELPGRETSALVAAVQASARLLQAGAIPEPPALEGLSAAVDAARRTLVLRGHQGIVSSAAFSPDEDGLSASRDRTLLTAGFDGTVRLWDARTGAPLRMAAAHPPGPCTARFSPDGQLVATISGDKTLALWETASLTLRRRITLDETPVGLYFSPDGKRLLVRTGARDVPAAAGVSLWDTASGRRVISALGQSSVAPPGPFSPDGSHLIVGRTDGVVSIYDTVRGELLGTLRVPKEYLEPSLLQAGYTPDGQQIIATTTAHEVIYSWDVKDGRFHVIHPAQGAETAFVSPDSLAMATTDRDYAVRLWEVRSGTQRATLLGHTLPVTSLAFSPSSRWLATAGGQSTIRLWDVRSGALRQTLFGHSDSVQTLAFGNDDAHLVSASADGSARVWSLEDGQHLLRLGGHGREVLDATYSSDGGYIATASRDATARVFDAQRGRLLATLPLPDEVNAVAFAPISSLLAVATGEKDRAIWIWDWREKRSLATLHGHTHSVQWLAFSPDGELLVSGSQDTTVRVWRWRTGEEMWRSTPGSDGEMVAKVDYSPDGRLIAAADVLGYVRLFSAETGALALTSSRNAGRMGSVAFSPVGNVLAIGGPLPAVLDSDKGNVLETLEGNAQAATNVTFSRNGRRLAAITADHTARVWELATGRTVQLLRIGSAASIEFSPDGQRLLVAHPADHSAKVYPATAAALLDAACELLRYQPEWEHVKTLCPASLQSR